MTKLVCWTISTQKNVPWLAALRQLAASDSFTSWVRKFHGILFKGTKVPGSKCSTERKFQGMKVPPIELSFPGAKRPGSEKSSILPYGHNRRFSGVTRGRISHFPIDFCMGPTTLQCWCTVCDLHIRPSDVLHSVCNPMLIVPDNRL